MLVFCSIRQRFFSNGSVLDPNRRKARLFLRRCSLNLAPIPRIADDPYASVYSHCNHRLAEYVLAKERAHDGGNEPEQGKSLQTRQQADQQKEQEASVFS